MKSWTTKNAVVTEIAFDHDLHAFGVTTLDGRELGVITPDSVDVMHVIIADLDAGACPIADHWEDGNGNTCSLSGWSA